MKEYISYSYHHSNFVSVFSADTSFLLPIGTTILAAVGVFALIMQFVISNATITNKHKSYSIINLLTMASVVCTLYFIILSIMYFSTCVDNSIYGHWYHKPAWGFFIECALLLAVSIMSLIIVFGKSNIKENASVTSTTASNYADELKSLKQLLDDGVITQEEFDAKKKQLLGL